MRIDTICGIIFLFLLVSCGSQTATPAPPTPTPIPAYVAGEEDLAYESFIDYYKENCWEFFELSNGDGISSGIDTSYEGRAVYVGDSMWRFRFRIKRTYIELVGDTGREEPMEPEEATLTVRSLPDGSWKDVCSGPRQRSETDFLDDQRDYEPYIPDEEDFDEPPEEDSW